MEGESILWMFIFMFTFYLYKTNIKNPTLKIGNKKLTGKLVVITGANSGIGYEIGMDLARRGARVILACRNKERGLHAQNEIRKLTQNQEIFYWQLDLSSFVSIKEFASKVRRRENSLYSLVNNAGLFWVPYQETKDGFESNFGVNHLGHFLLTMLLLPILEKERSRIVFVGSLMYMFGKIDFEDLNFTKRGYNFARAYADSKLANLLLCRELSRRLLSENIHTYCTDPGVVSTKIGKDSFMGSYLYKYILQPTIASLLMRTPVDGAKSSIYCVCSDDVADDSGNFYTGAGIEEPWASGVDDISARRLWEISLQLTKLGSDELKQYVH